MEDDQTTPQNAEQPSTTVSDSGDAASKTPEDVTQQLRSEVESYKDKYLRLLAESENTRKRMLKERQESTKHAIADVINEFLHPLDHLEKALGFTQKASDEVKNWARGFEMILAQFKDVLQNHGITAYESVGRHFDPHFHEAVEMIETSEHPPGVIISEDIKGYRMGERTLRPARVRVAKAPTPPSESPSEKELNN
jgi:molecular chaperone GrpE